MWAVRRVAGSVAGVVVGLPHPRPIGIPIGGGGEGLVGRGLGLSQRQHLRRRQLGHIGHSGCDRREQRRRLGGVEIATATAVEFADPIDPIDPIETSTASPDAPDAVSDDITDRQAVLVLARPPAAPALAGVAICVVRSGTVVDLVDPLEPLVQKLPLPIVEGVHRAKEEHVDIVLLPATVDPVLGLSDERRVRRQLGKDDGRRGGEVQTGTAGRDRYHRDADVGRQLELCDLLVPGLAVRLAVDSDVHARLRGVQPGREFVHDLFVVRKHHNLARVLGPLAVLQRAQLLQQPLHHHVGLGNPDTVKLRKTLALDLVALLVPHNLPRRRPLALHRLGQPHHLPDLVRQLLGDVRLHPADHDLLPQEQVQLLGTAQTRVVDSESRTQKTTRHQPLVAVLDAKRVARAWEHVPPNHVDLVVQIERFVQRRRPRQENDVIRPAADRPNRVGDLRVASRR